jgi:hypothetical protein
MKGVARHCPFRQERGRHGASGAQQEDREENTHESIVRRRTSERFPDPDQRDADPELSPKLLLREQMTLVRSVEEPHRLGEMLRCRRGRVRSARVIQEGSADKVEGEGGRGLGEDRVGP